MAKIQKLAYLEEELVELSKKLNPKFSDLISELIQERLNEKHIYPEVEFTPPVETEEEIQKRIRSRHPHRATDTPEIKARIHDSQMIANKTYAERYKLYGRHNDTTR